jgi:hypothetical protein
MDKMTLLRFVGDGTTVGANATALEGEIGGSINESINKAIDIAVQAAVINTIQEGARKGHWAFKSDVVQSYPAPVIAVPAKEEPKIEEKKEEVKVEEKKDVVVQPQAKSETKTEAAPSAAAEVKKEEPKKIDPVTEESKMYLVADSYIYREPNEKSQRTWLLKANTEMKVNPAEGDWVAVVAGDGKRGFVKRSSLVAK